MRNCIRDSQTGAVYRQIPRPSHAPELHLCPFKKIYRDQRFHNHPKNRGKALKADKRLRTIAGRLVRELRRHQNDNHAYETLLGLFERVLSQKRNSPGKIYSLHKPEVPCISKGKEHKKYEFGNKVSIIPPASY